MSARRCSDCGLDWPVSEDYESCPQCLCPTDHMTTAHAMRGDEAKHLASTLAFEREYDRRERGLSSRCGSKRTLSAWDRQRLEIPQDRSEELFAQGLMINQLERIYRAS